MRKSKQRIGVSGMHGKSTATAMISHIFLAAKLDPTIVLGAELAELDGAYRVGAGDSFILEACEYQDSFLSFVPNIAVVLNIDMDHPDYFHSLEQIITSFSRYLEIASDGYAVGESRRRQCPRRARRISRQNSRLWAGFARPRLHGGEYQLYTGLSRV